jgi:hypothetical protein
MKTKTIRIKPFAVLAAIFVVMLICAGSVSAETPSAKWANAADCTGSPGGGEWINGDCYVIPTPIKIGVSIGGLTQATLSQYLAAAFNLGIGIAAVLAVIFIMIGGFRYIAAAGGGEVESGKSMIKNAVIGLVLTMLSYTLLQTINPAILSLSLPPIKKVKQIPVQTGSTSGFQDTMIGNPCFTIKDKDACAQACITAGLTDSDCQCVVIPPSIWEEIGSFVGGQVAAQTAAHFISDVGQAAESGTIGAAWCTVATGELWNCIKNDGLKAASDSYAASVSDTASAGQEGICLPLAVHSIPLGGTCNPDRSVGCVTNSTGGNSVCIKVADGVGMCTSGEENTPCYLHTNTFFANDAAFSVNGNASACSSSNLSCCTTPGTDFGTCLKSCSSRADGATCSQDSDCGGGHCVTIPSGATSQQTNNMVCTSGEVGDFCGKPGDCDTPSYCPTTLYTCTGSACPLYRECSSAVPSGSICCNTGECQSGLKCTGASPVGGQCSVVNGACVTTGSGKCGTCQ